MGRRFVSNLDFQEGKPTLHPPAELRLPWDISFLRNLSEKFYCLPFRNGGNSFLWGHNEDTLPPRTQGGSRDLEFPPNLLQMSFGKCSGSGAEPGGAAWTLGTV